MVESLYPLLFFLKYLSRRVLNEISVEKLDGRDSGLTYAIPTAASVEQSSDDSVVSQDELIMMKLIEREGTVGPVKDDSNDWMTAVATNLVAKGFATMDSERKVSLTEKGKKKSEGSGITFR